VAAVVVETLQELVTVEPEVEEMVAQEQQEAMELQTLAVVEVELVILGVILGQLEVVDLVDQV
jgi:two-component SAPR family response regulator